MVLCACPAPFTPLPPPPRPFSMISHLTTRKLILEETTPLLARPPRSAHHVREGRQPLLRRPLLQPHGAGRKRLLPRVPSQQHAASGYVRAYREDWRLVH